MIGELISAGTKLIGGLMGQNEAENDAEMRKNLALENMEQQRKFAQEGIRWKVADAIQAGIHPLYALGANTTSFSPVSVGGSASNPLGDAIGSMGQDIGRAVNATRTVSERDAAFMSSMKAAQLEGANLDNDIKRASLASSIARLRDNANPPNPGAFPTPSLQDKPEKRPPLQFGGREWKTDPNTSNAQEGETRYGDDGLPSWILPMIIGWQDMKANFGNASIVDVLRTIDRATSTSIGMRSDKGFDPHWKEKAARKLR